MIRKQKQAAGQEHGIPDGRAESNGRIKIVTRILDSGLFMDALSCVLLSAGSLMAMLAPTALDGGLYACLILSGVFVLLIVFSSRRWWVLPFMLMASVIVYFAYLIWTNGFSEQFLYWREFARWIMSGAPYTQGVTGAGFLMALQAAAALPAAFVLFVLIRRFFWFPVILLLQAGVFILSYMLVDTDLSAALCLSAAGLIILLPGVYARWITKPGGFSGGNEMQGAPADQKLQIDFRCRSAARGRQHSTEEAPVEKISQELVGQSTRARMQAVAVLAAAIIVPFSMWIVPQDTGHWKSHRLNVWLNDINTLIAGPFGRWPASFSSFHLYQLGLQWEAGRLGGPASLNDDVYLLVFTGRPVLLKGRVLDYYTGSGWTASVPDGDLRLRSPFWSAIRRETFDYDMPTGTGQAALLYEQLTTELEITIIPRATAFTTLFSPENFRGVSFGNHFKSPEAYFNRRSEVYMHSYVARASEYTVRARVWNTGMHGFDELFTQLEEQAPDERRYSGIAGRYTRLPEDLPLSVRRTAEAVTEGIDSPYLKAQAISRWLFENAEYTLEPGVPPEGADFTAHFLETREGYCVYFATAMTVMARCAGLPARYVQGFALEAAPGGRSYQATGKTAHAWSEVYFEGIGWLPVDPLNWNEEDPLNEAAPIIRPDEYIPQGPGQSGQTQTHSQSEGRANTWMPLLLIPALYGLFRWALWVGPRHKTRIWAYESVCRRCPGTRDALDALYYDTLRLLRLRGMTVQPGETLVTFPQRVDRAVRFSGVTLAETAGALMRSHFGGAAPTAREVERACLYHGHLESMTLNQLGKTRYLLGRVLMEIRPAPRNKP